MNTPDTNLNVTLNPEEMGQLYAALSAQLDILLGIQQRTSGGEAAHVGKQLAALSELKRKIDGRK